MTRAEFKLRDQGTLLGFLWTLLHPLLLFVVLYALFMRWLGKFVDQYAAYLLIGLVFWNFFQKGTSVGLTSFRRRVMVVRNFRFPREIVVFSAVGAVFISTLMELAVLVPFLLVMGVRARWSWLALPLFSLLLFMLTAAIAAFLAVFASRFRDLERIWDIASTALFYLTPIFYPLSVLSGWRRALLALSPLTMILSGARACLLDGRLPPAATLMSLIAFVSLGLLAGLAFIRRVEPKLADVLVAA